MQYIYLLESDSYFKIGIAYDIRSRIAQLSTGNPHAIGLVSCYGFDNAGIVEQAIHQRFKNEKQRGEWFKLTGQNIAEFNDLCELLGGQGVLESNEVNEADIEQADDELGIGERIEFHCHNKDGRHVHSVFIVNSHNADKSRGRVACGSIEYPRPELENWKLELEEYMKNHACFMRAITDSAAWDDLRDVMAEKI